MQRYIIVYPKGDKSKLSIALSWDYEEKEYAIASRRWFNRQNDAIIYAKDLAKENNKLYNGPNVDNEPDYLD